MIAALLLACQDEQSPEERWQHLAELKTPTAEQCDEQFVLMYTSTLEPYAKSLCETSDNASCLRYPVIIWPINLQPLREE